MKFELRKTFKIDAAHRLTGLPPGHKCARLHGHTFSIQVVLEGELDPRSGVVMDYNQIRAEVEPVLEQLDHRYLNEVPGLENPTSENIAAWLWSRLKPRLQGLKEIQVSESDSSLAVFRGPDPEQTRQS